MCMQLMDGLCKELICAVTGLSEWLIGFDRVALKNVYLVEA